MAVEIAYGVFAERTKALLKYKTFPSGTPGAEIKLRGPWPRSGPYAKVDVVVIAVHIVQCAANVVLVVQQDAG